MICCLICFLLLMKLSEEYLHISSTIFYLLSTKLSVNCLYILFMHSIFNTLIIYAIAKQNLLVNHLV